MFLRFCDVLRCAQMGIPGNLGYNWTDFSAFGEKEIL